MTNQFHLESVILHEITLLIDNSSALDDLSDIWEDIGSEAQKEVVRSILEEFERGTTNPDIATMLAAQATSQTGLSYESQGQIFLNVRDEVIAPLREIRDTFVAENNLETVYLGDRPEPRREPRREPSRETQAALDNAADISRERRSPRSGSWNLTVEEGDHKFFIELYEALKEDNPDFENYFKEAVLVEDMTFDEIFDISNRNKFVMALENMGITTRKYGLDVQRSGDWHPVGNQLYEFVNFDYIKEDFGWWVNQTPSGNAVQEFAKKNKIVLSHTGLALPRFNEQYLDGDGKLPDNWVMLNQFRSGDIEDNTLPLSSGNNRDVTIKNNFDELADANARNRLFIFPEDMETVQNKLGKLHNKIIKTKLFPGGSDKIVQK